MAQVLKVSDRSIERDKRAIREANALPKDPQLVGQMVGRLVNEAELSVQRIRKITRDKSVLPESKIDAEHRCYQIVSDLVQRLQGLGYLPMASQKVEADLTHHLGEVPTFDALEVEVKRIKALAESSAGGVPGEVLQLEQQVIRAGLAANIERAGGAVIAATQHQENQNGAG
jgi:hypothetical protein